MLFLERGYVEGTSLAFPVARTSPFNPGGVSSIPDPGAMILYVSQSKKKNIDSMVTNLIKPFKMAHIKKKKNLKRHYVGSQRNT